MIGLAVFVLVAALIAGYFWLQVRSLRHWTGVFWMLACVPLLVWAVWLANFLRDVAADPTDHNLFPFEMAAIMVAGFAFLGAVAAIRMVVQPHR